MSLKKSVWTVTQESAVILTYILVCILSNLSCPLLITKGAALHVVYVMWKCEIYRASCALRKHTAILVEAWRRFESRWACIPMAVHVSFLRITIQLMRLNDTSC
jgi:hypothetical protein